MLHVGLNCYVDFLRNLPTILAFLLLISRYLTNAMAPSLIMKSAIINQFMNMSISRICISASTSTILLLSYFTCEYEYQDLQYNLNNIIFEIFGRPSH